MKPRDYADVSRLFGKLGRDGEDLIFEVALADVLAGPTPRRQALAAVRQHFELRTYRLLMITAFGTQDSYCDATGFDRSHLSRLLNGHLYMTYEDLASFDADLGPLTDEPVDLLRDILEQARYDIDQRLRAEHVNFVLPSPLTNEERAMRALSPKRVQIREPFTNAQRATNRVVTEAATHGLALAVPALAERAGQRFTDPEIGVKLTTSSGAAGDFGQGHLVANIDLDAHRWARDVVSPGHVVLDDHFVLSVERTDLQGHPTKVRVLGIEENPTTSGGWGTVADVPADVRWDNGEPSVLIAGQGSRLGDTTV